jgi:amidase
MAPLDYKTLVAKELKRRDSTFPKWYFELHDAPEDVLNVTEIPEKSGILSSKDIEITHCDGVAVVEAIKAKKYSCVEVIEAFSKRALLAQKYVFPTPDKLMKDKLPDRTDV